MDLYGFVSCQVNSIYGNTKPAVGNQSLTMTYGVGLFPTCQKVTIHFPSHGLGQHHKSVQQLNDRRKELDDRPRSTF